MLRDHGHGIVADERRPAGHHLVEHATECVKVAGWSRLAAHRLLRRHVARRAHHHPRHRQPRAVERHGQPEVADLGHARTIEPDVSRLQVAVHDPAGVGVLQPRADLLGDADGRLDRQAVIFALLQCEGEVAPGHVLRDDVWLRALLIGVEDGHDVRVVAQPPHRLRLALDARQPVGVQPFCLDQGKRDVAVQLLV
ncbi:MAG: hypothetical protein M3O21_03065, partial [Chloroflexota bacterium]|nr:hypothetical protein [Chloroflexota bacterium]